MSPTSWSPSASVRTRLPTFSDSPALHQTPSPPCTIPRARSRPSGPPPATPSPTTPAQSSSSILGRGCSALMQPTSSLSPASRSERCPRPDRSACSHPSPSPPHQVLRGACVSCRAQVIFDVISGQIAIFADVEDPQRTCIVRVDVPANLTTDVVGNPNTGGVGPAPAAARNAARGARRVSRGVSFPLLQGQPSRWPTSPRATGPPPLPPP